MRGRKQDGRSGGQRRRRCILAGLLVASGQVALAQRPAAVAPLPLATPEGASGQMQINPFCQPVPAIAGGLAELTAEDSSARLGESAAVGEPRRAGQTAASLRRGSETTILGPQPARLIQVAGGTGPDHGARVVQSSGRRGGSPERYADDGGMRALLQESQQDTSGGVRANPLASRIPLPVADVAGVKPLVAQERPAVPSGPVSFSFSDDTAIPVDTTPAPPAGASAGPVVRETAPTDLVEVGQRSRARSRAPWVASEAPAPERGDRMASLARPSSQGRTIIVPAGDGPGVQTALAVGRVPLPGSSPSEPRLVNGSRPKVEVGRPPVAVQRGIQLSSTADQERKPLMVETTPPPEEVQKPKPVPEPPITATLRFKPTEVRALKIDNPIQRAEVQNAAVCAAVKAGPNQLQVIAIGDGVTKLNLWTLDGSGKEQHEVYEIQVAEVPTAQSDELENIAATLTQSVRSAFPKSQVQVRYSSGRLIATGTCQDEESARRILRMIRSACQMPVDDRVSVR